MLFPWAFVPWLTFLELIGLASFISSFKLWVARVSFIFLYYDEACRQQTITRDLYMEWLLD